MVVPVQHVQNHVVEDSIGVVVILVQVVLEVQVILLDVQDVHPAIVHII